MLRSRHSLATTLLILVYGCATSAPQVQQTRCSNHPPANPPYVTVPEDDVASELDVIGWLRRNNIRTEKDPNGDQRIFDSPACRTALVQYRRVLRLRLDVIAKNMVNANSTHDSHGALNPYRREFVVVDQSGAITVKEDQSPFLKRYDPAHPDADPKGYVSYPNIDPAIESVNARQAAREYRMVTRILQHFDPTMVGTFEVDPTVGESLWQ